MHPLIRAACAFAVAAPGLAGAQTAADIQSLREEINALRTQYEARIKALESKLEAAQAQAAPAAPAAAAPAPSLQGRRVAETRRGPYRLA